MTVELGTAVGDAIGMCRFNTKLFNSPSTPDLADLANQISELTQLSFNEFQLDEIGRNITGLERMLNFRLGLRQEDDTLPARWFDEPIMVGPFKGEKIDLFFKGHQQALNWGRQKVKVAIWLPR